MAKKLASSPDLGIPEFAHVFELIDEGNPELSPSSNSVQAAINEAITLSQETMRQCTHGKFENIRNYSAELLEFGFENIKRSIYSQIARELYIRFIGELPITIYGKVYTPIITHESTLGAKKAVSAMNDKEQALFLDADELLMASEELNKLLETSMHNESGKREISQFAICKIAGYAMRIGELTHKIKMREYEPRARTGLRKQKRNQEINKKRSAMLLSRNKIIITTIESEIAKQKRNRQKPKLKSAYVVAAGKFNLSLESVEIIYA